MSWFRVRNFLPLLLMLLNLTGITEATEIPSIVVTAKKNPPKASISESGLAESVQIAPGRTTSYSQLVQSSAGVLVRNTGGEGTDPVFLVRGQDSIQTRYFIEGVPLSDAQFNQSNLQWLPLRSLGSMEVYPQNVPVSLGEDGMGGAIQFTLTKKPQSSVGARSGSYRFLNGFGALNSEKINLHLDYRESRENFVYYDDKGTPFDASSHQLLERNHNAFHRFSLVVQVPLFERSDKKWSLFSINGIGNNEIPGPTQLPNRANLNQWFHLSAVKHKNRVSDISEAEGHLFFRYQNDRLQFETPAPLYGGGNSNNIAIGIREKLSLQSFSFVTGATGNFYSREYQALPHLSHSRIDFPLGASAVFPLAGKYLTIKPALLSQYFHYRSDNSPQRNFFLYSPRMDFLCEPWKNFRLRSSVGKYYRAPTLFELYGSPTGISSNQGLSAEQGWQGEIGFDVELEGNLIKKTRLSYTLSASRAENLIVLLPNSQQTRIAQNIGRSQIVSHGISGELRPVHRNLFLKSGITFMNAFNLTDTPYEYAKRLPGRPEHRINASVGFETNQWFLEYSIGFNGAQYWDSANQRRLSPTSQHDVRVAYETKNWGNFSIEALNLFDSLSAPSEYDRFRTIDNTTAFLGYPAPGRRYYFSWSLNI